MAHTGAVAGSVEACDAALAASGAIQVFTLDELLETAALVSQIRGRPAFSNTARKIGALSLSGGEIALALDAAEECGVAFAPLAEAEAKIRPLMPEFSHLSNPLDLTWAGLYDAKVAEGCAKAMGELAEVGALVLLQDAPTGLGAQQAGRYATLLAAVSRGAEAAAKSHIPSSPAWRVKRACPICAARAKAWRRSAAMRSGRPGDCARKRLKRTATKNNLRKMFLSNFACPLSTRRAASSRATASPGRRSAWSLRQKRRRRPQRRSVSPSR
jgi:hypothetical protein